MSGLGAPAYIDCFNCNAHEEHSECGMSMRGCELCRKYGDGDGQLLAQYAGQNLVVNGKVYDAPSILCFKCGDTGKATVTIRVESMKDPLWSDNGEHNMPRVALPCWKCKSDEYTAAYEAEKARQNALHP